MKANTDELEHLLVNWERSLLSDQVLPVVQCIREHGMNYVFTECFFD